MHTSSHRFIAPFVGSLVTAAVLATILAPTALGALTRRTWTATFTGGGASGTATLAINTNSTGSVTVRVAGLQPSSIYTQLIYSGSCGSPSTVLKLPGLAVSVDGLGSRTMPLTAAQGRKVSDFAAGHSIAIRIATPGQVRCAVLSYPLATRVAISKYGIDLPIVKQVGSAYPLCNVAMYLPALSQPGERGVTFIFAHARTGMFLPLLTASRVNSGKAMVGAIVKVWTSDSKLHTYQIVKVLRHTYVFPNYDPNVEQLFLQTSEGPHGTPNKLVITAKRLAVTTVSYAEAHPKPHPLVCR
jgi:hypothetical protein